MAEPPWVYQMLEDDERREENTVRRLAKHFWEKAGKPEGQDLKFWTKAEKFYKEYAKFFK